MSILVAFEWHYFQELLNWWHSPINLVFFIILGSAEMMQKVHIWATFLEMSTEIIQYLLQIATEDIDTFLLMIREY